jgi:hypothetical protein
MKLTLEYSDADVAKLQKIVAAQQQRVFVVQRIQRNVLGAIPPADRETIWLTMLMCLLSTQQRSNVSSPISRFLFQKPFPLSLVACSSAENVEELVLRQIADFGGIRFAPKISQQVRANFEKLQNGEWQNLEQHLASLHFLRERAPRPEDYLVERQAARYMQGALGGFAGFGPKQSRNFWQSLGVMRYEFVLDSRVLKFLRELALPLPLSSLALGEEEYYCFLSDLLRDLCLKAGLLPCVLDAAIFSSFDQEEWPDNLPVW